MELNGAQDKYFTEVIQRGDEASGSFKDACKEGNQSSIAYKNGILNEDGSIVVDHFPIKLVKESIDGVGTKVQIYTNQFENIFQGFEKGEINGDSAREQSVELWTRMLCDLIAMNIDDLRNGELGIAVTNIIDINHLSGPRGHLFQDTMSQAFKNVIELTGIAMTAGETAVLGVGKHTKDVKRLVNEQNNKLREILKNMPSIEGVKEINQQLESILKEYEDKIDLKLQGIDLNIGGTSLGLTLRDKKLGVLASDQSIVALLERPSNGIIGPRSNGITKIREDMETIMGDGWENKFFEEFIEMIGGKAELIPENVKNDCAGKQMWDIATGKTTIFNPFVANVLLGGLNSSPMARISRIIHVTGNPQKKISEGLGDNNYTVSLDISELQTPHIIVLLQAALGISDEQAMNKWNMGVPYTLICESDDVDMIVELAQNNGIVAKKIGTVSDKFMQPKNSITGVGLGNSSMNF